MIYCKQLAAFVATAGTSQSHADGTCGTAGSVVKWCKNLQEANSEMARIATVGSAEWTGGTHSRMSG